MFDFGGDDETDDDFGEFVPSSCIARWFGEIWAICLVYGKFCHMQASHESMTNPSPTERCPCSLLLFSKRMNNLSLLMFYLKHATHRYIGISDLVMNYHALARRLALDLGNDFFLEANFSKKENFMYIFVRRILIMGMVPSWSVKCVDHNKTREVSEF